MMNISNLNELLNTQITNKGSVSSVGGFALELKELKHGYAFFCQNEEDLDKALQQGAFAIISEKELAVKDKEVFYLKSKNLKNSLTRLLRFISEEKELCFLKLDTESLNFSKAFSLQKLQGDVCLDFNLLLKAKQKAIFCYDEESYLLQLGAYYERLPSSCFEILNHSSLFFTNLLCENSYFKNLHLPFIYAEIFAHFVAFFEQKKMPLHFDSNKLDFFNVCFINGKMELTEFGKSSRAFIIVFKENDFLYWQKACHDIKGFKSAKKNSLSCDFSYQTLNDLRKLKDFRYLLILLENREEFFNEFSAQQKEFSLFK
ncbi:hypothetical protein OQH60_02620 [Campylobacter sp. MIT 21-1685]|uniref:hypothetical protein n=1 Tax=unclassified Campylobacter TaxID=2593542 RepID=UPI00224A9286|nr:MULTISPECIES: hypothetical protein [unclassified Campylobacter]MCX2682763.1 hypothetical protein [Campylobacter sp. MIT 21-1684]MCX2751091.1 hypothetical protein [Campylobacter sp. MIT 21-1682]MCX2807244.1 hypothetical protein [Campylobacter sp. MIT 21-1685]